MIGTITGHQAKLNGKENYPVNKLKSVSIESEKKNVMLGHWIICSICSSSVPHTTAAKSSSCPILWNNLIFGSNKRPSLLNNLKFRSNVRPSFQPTSGCRSESFYTQECQALRSKLSADTLRDVISDGNLKHLTIDAKLTD